MHEFSIVMNIVEIAEQEVRKHEADRVELIVLDIGKLSGVEPAALDFAWDQAVLETVLEKAERKTNYIEGKAHCQECGIEFTIEYVFESCPACNSYKKELLAGNELLVKSLTLI